MTAIPPFGQSQKELDGRLRRLSNRLNSQFKGVCAGVLLIVEWSVGKYVFDAWKRNWEWDREVYNAYFHRDRLRRGRGAQTAAHYLTATKQFVRWLVKDRRTPDNPLAYLSVANAQAELRHDRRALTDGEIRNLLETADASEQTFRGLTGRERHALYVTACATGFRKGELA